MSSTSTIWATLSAPVPSGRVIIPQGKSSIVITYGNAQGSSIIHTQLESADATLTRLTVTPAAGSFTITGNAAATLAVTLTYLIFNPGVSPAG